MRRPIYPENPNDAEEYERDLAAHEKHQEELAERDREEKAESNQQEEK